jgi:hypothetical protein
MKKVNGLYAGVFVLLTLFTACTNDKSSVDYAQIDAEKAKVSSSLVLTKAYNDTLKMFYDTVKVRKNNVYCLKYDKLYHKNDSLFTMHYNMFGSMMNDNGIMMSNYTQGGGMMQGSTMMNSDSKYYNTMMADTATVGGYYRAMCVTRLAHQTYHNAIYN